MRRIWFTIALLAACGYPRLAQVPRTGDQAEAAAIGVSTSCADEDLGDFLSGYQRTGTGVMIDQRHALTAGHVIECPVIPVVHATLSDGSTTRMVVDEDDVMFGSGRDVARLVVLADEDLGRFAPPVLGDGVFGGWCAATLRGPVCGEVLYYDRGEAVLDVATRVGDSGAGVYDGVGRLAGIVVAGSEHHTRVARLDGSWLP